MLVPEISQELQESDFTCAAFVPAIDQTHPSGLIMVGTADGAVAAMFLDQRDRSNIRNLEWLDRAKKMFVLSEAISSIIYRSNVVVISGSQGTIIRYEDKQRVQHAANKTNEYERKVFPPDDSQRAKEDKLIMRIETEHPIIAIQMDAQNNQGVVGSSDGTIKYIHFADLPEEPTTKYIKKKDETKEPKTKHN